MHKVRPLRSADRDQWFRMRTGLWPDESQPELAAEGGAFLDGRSQLLTEVFVSEDERGSLIGFLELFVRNYAEGCAGATPYVEGWYVIPSARGKGVGRALMDAAEAWSRKNGYREIASDTWLDNLPSQRAHTALGFEEVERAVHFRKAL